MIRKKITTLSEYIDVLIEIHEAEECVGVPRNSLYRGQSNSKYRIVPSLCHKIVNIAGDDGDDYFVFEKEIINRIKVEYPQLFTSDNSIDELAMMQHYGIPTRLMDVTDNPLVALFFACCSNKGEDGEVFVFSSAIIPIYTSYDEKKIKTNNELAFVRAKINSKRQRAQQGLFMWFPNSHLSGIPKEDDEGIILPYILTIPSENKGILLEQLSLVGISRRTLFPDDIDSCCKEIINSITKNAFSA